MLFPSEEFLLIFLPVVLAGYYGIHILTHNIILKNVWLLVSSIIFYAWGEPVYVFLMLGYIIFDHLMALCIGRTSPEKRDLKRALLILTIAVNLSGLIWFKYAGAVLAGTGLSYITEKIVLPIGISFYTFQAMSYVIDVYRGSVTAEVNPLYTGLYISFFPQLIAGPIVRFDNVRDRMRDRHESLSSFCTGAERFMRGMIKKVLIANRMAAVADAVWGLMIDGKLEAGVSLAWLGAISYTLQIFFDFSGYSDMAIGLSAMFGFKIPENFDHPYIAKSVTEFWRRWHITLSGWFRDYVYIPLGGSKTGRGRLIFNLFIVWLLTGIWHGDNLTFVLWGMIYFIILTIEKMVGVRVEKSAETEDDGHGLTAAGFLTNTVKRLYTLLTVVLAWVVFRSESIGDAWGYIRGMFGLSGIVSSGAAAAYLKQNLVYYIAAVILCLPIRSYIGKKAASCEVSGSENEPSSRTRLSAASLYGALYGVLIAGGFVLALTYIYNNAYSPFIYFNF